MTPASTMAMNSPTINQTGGATTSGAPAGGAHTSAAGWGKAPVVKIQTTERSAPKDQSLSCSLVPERFVDLWIERRGEGLAALLQLCPITDEAALRRLS